MIRFQNCYMPRSNKPRPARHILVWGITQLFWLRGCVSIDFSLKKRSEDEIPERYSLGQGLSGKGIRFLGRRPCLPYRVAWKDAGYAGRAYREAFSRFGAHRRPAQRACVRQRKGAFNKVYQYRRRRGLCRENAVPTAEGALMLILETPTEPSWACMWRSRGLGG